MLGYFRRVLCARVLVNTRKPIKKTALEPGLLFPRRAIPSLI